MSNQVYSNDVTPYPVTADVVSTNVSCINLFGQNTGCNTLFINNPSNSATGKVLSWDLGTSVVGYIDFDPTDYITPTSVNTLTNKVIDNLVATGNNISLYSGKVIKTYGMTSTINAVTNTLFSIAVPNNTNIIASVLITGFCSVGTDIGKYVSYNASYTANNKAGVLTTSTIVSNNARSTAFAGATVTITSSGTSLLIQVNGILGDTINWNGEINIIFQ